MTVGRLGKTFDPQSSYKMVISVREVLNYLSTIYEKYKFKFYDKLKHDFERSLLCNLLFNE